MCGRGHPCHASGVFGRLAALVLARRGPFLVGLLLVLGLTALGVSRIRLDFSSQSFFGGDAGMQEDLKAFQDAFGVDDDEVIVVAKVEHGDLLEPGRVRLLTDLGQSLRALDDVRGVKSPFAALKTQLEAAPGAADRVRDGVRDGPLVPAAMAGDLRVGALVVETRMGSDDVQAVVPAIAAIEGVVAEYDSRAGITLGLAGIPAIRAGFFRLTLADQMWISPLTFGLLGMCLLGVFRRTHAALVPLVAAGIPTVMTVGLMGLTGEPVGLLNQAYFTLLPVIAVADAVHLVARFHEERARGLSREDAIVAAGGRIGAACLLTSVTTAIGLGSLVMADMPILRHFGLYAAAGVLFAYATVLIVVPLALSWIPLGADGVPTEGRLARAMARVAQWSHGHPGRVSVLTVAVVALCVWQAGRVEVDNRLTGLLMDDHPVSEASRTVDARLSGILAAEVDLQVETGTLETPAVAEAQDTLSTWAEQQPGVRAVVGLGAPGHLVEGGRRGRLSVRTADRGGVAFEDLADQLAARAQEAFGPIGVQARVTGTPFVAYRGVNRITRDVRASMALAFAVVALVVGLLFRSPKMLLVALIPNTLPLLVGFSVMATLGESLDPLAAVIMTMALGIAVDDTIHVMARFREELRAGVPQSEAIHRSVLHSGRAVGITTFALTIGLAMNLFSSFPALVMLGFLGAVIMVAALLCDIIVLPALLRLARWRPAAG